MTFREAVIKSMRAYYAGQSPEKLSSVSSKRMKYTKKYFDKMSDEFGIETVDISKEKTKRGY